MASLELIPWLVGPQSGRKVLPPRSIASNAVQFFRLRSVNQFAHRHLTSNGFILLFDSFLVKINKICTLLQQISISSSQDHNLPLGNSAPGECREMWRPIDLDLLPGISGSIILFDGLLNELRNMLIFSFSLPLNSSININNVIELRNRKIGPLVIHTVQTLPLDINFVFWILLVSQVWIEQESKVVSNH